MTIEYLKIIIEHNGKGIELDSEWDTGVEKNQIRSNIEQDNILKNKSRHDHITF